ncbi:MAG: hypothetical protein E3J76_02630, partial [Candidatus Aminicenantes bacterium]
MQNSSGFKFLSVGIFLTAIIFFNFFGCSQRAKIPADLVLLKGDIYTVNPDYPVAKALVITDNKITAVFKKDKDAKKYIGEQTTVIDLEGKFVTPGIIDGHVHFNRAGALINDANLMTVSDEEGLKKEISRVAELLDDGEWITEGLWGAYEQWALGDAGEETTEEKETWRPNRYMIDDLTPNNPTFICRFDYKEWLANTSALKAAGLEKAKLDGMEIGADGRPTGIIFRSSPAFESLSKARKPKSHGRLLDENRAALRALREAGIVEVHDIAAPVQTQRFIELQENGELTCRVWLRPDLSRGAKLKKQGFTMGLHPKTKEKDLW